MMGFDVGIRSLEYTWRTNINSKRGFGEIWKMSYANIYRNKTLSWRRFSKMDQKRLVPGIAINVKVTHDKSLILN